MFPQNPLDVQVDKLLLLFVLSARVHIVEDVLQLQHQSSNELLFVSCIKRVTFLKGSNRPCEWIPVMWHLIGCGISLLPYGQLSADDALSLFFRLFYLGLVLFFCSCVR